MVAKSNRLGPQSVLLVCGTEAAIKRKGRRHSHCTDRGEILRPVKNGLERINGLNH